jgi:hypothetical protein
MAALKDPETCSRCLVEVEWEDLFHIPSTGENVCEADIEDDEWSEAERV